MAPHCVFFYVCKRDGNRVSYLTGENALGTEWPPEVFDRAVKDRVIDPTGRVVRV